MKKFLAIFTIILLIALYALTIVFALIDNPATMNLLWASIGATVMIPVTLWLGMMFLKGRRENKDNMENKEK